MPNYVKRHWNETRGDQFDGWGTSWWYFETADDGGVIRQVENYESGVFLYYDAKRDVDSCGGLVLVPLDLSNPHYLYILKHQFEAIWERAVKAAE